MKGIEIEPFAVKLARVTMWIGHKQAVDKLGVDEPVLPLVDLSEIRQGDSLRLPWPRADAIISNPPYHGSQRLRKELGDEYVEWLKQEFGIGVKDYAAYWFRKAHPHLADRGRAGLVVTNSISQNRNRKPTLDWILDKGAVVTNAISTQDWSGEAAVDVSIVNWIKKPADRPARYVLDGREVVGISPSLGPAELDVGDAERLPANRGIGFQGPIPADNGGFLLDPQEAEKLLALADADYRDVVRPYLTSEDIGLMPLAKPSRFAIDFAQRSLEDAALYPAALEIVRHRVKPFRDANRDRGFREKWWLFGRPRPAMRKALVGLSRYIAGTRHGTRLHFCWCDPWVLASDATNVFALEDSYALGVLTSTAHVDWAWKKSGSIRTDIRYTLTAAFETFPWPPSPDVDQRQRVAEVADRIFRRREEV